MLSNPDFSILLFQIKICIYCKNFSANYLEYMLTCLFSFSQYGMQQSKIWNFVNCLTVEGKPKQTKYPNFLDPEKPMLWKR